MDNYSVLVWLLPIVFMIHDFEEIIFFKPWVNRNKDYLTEKFPELSKRILFRFEGLSTSAFALAVAEEFILLSLITAGSVLSGHYILWLAVFMGFFVHLWTHLGQWIMLKRYIPAIGTTFISLAYGIGTLYVIIANDIYRVPEIAAWTVAGTVLVGVNLFFAHKLAGIFDRWIKKMEK